MFDISINRVKHAQLLIFVILHHRIVLLLEHNVLLKSQFPLNSWQIEASLLSWSFFEAWEFVLIEFFFIPSCLERRVKLFRNGAIVQLLWLLLLLRGFYRTDRANLLGQNFDFGFQHFYLCVRHLLMGGLFSILAKFCGLSELIHGWVLSFWSFELERLWDHLIKWVQLLFGLFKHFCIACQKV